VKQGRLVLSCEHGGNRIPARYRWLFQSARARRALASHRGCDIGALALARGLAKSLDVELFSATISRLLVDLNRSPGHRARFSEFTRSLSRREKAELTARHYDPHRNAIETAVRAAANSARRPVVHVAVHSFASALDGVHRRADIGLLYDPKREPEREFCLLWQRALRQLAPDLEIKRNYPYRGTADGLTTALRRLFAPTRYIGIELEMNQALLLEGGTVRRDLVCLLSETLARVLGRKP
jgi:predicted N-formylglutamate amidohydrolase